MRLVESEKDHLSGWVLLAPGFDTGAFQMILEMLDFPFVYATRDVIAYIRNNISDTIFLDKCRFFELFPALSDERKIGNFLLKNTQAGLSLGSGGKICIDTLHMKDPTATLRSS